MAQETYAQMRARHVGEFVSFLERVDPTDSENFKDVIDGATHYGLDFRVIASGTKASISTVIRWHSGFSVPTPALCKKIHGRILKEMRRRLRA